MLKDKTIILGVTGGIAVYKAADIVSRLKKLHANVEVIMTEGAAEFVTPLTFQTMSGNVVHREMFSEITNYDVEHISLAQKADIILIAPATANTIGKIANGIADNLLTTVVMASTAKIVFAPAMNTKMYQNPIVKDNMEKLKKLGYKFIQPAVGMLACGDYGEGKMAEPVDIVEYIVDSFVKKDLFGKKIVITAGPTMEPLDPVRYMTNHSSGKMGYSIAKEAVTRGAEVVLISGPTSITPPSGVELIKVKTTEDMLNAVDKYFDSCDVLIKSAAPVDYRPETVSSTKIKKKENEEDELIIKYVKNPDIAAHFGEQKKNQVMVGFAAETNNLDEYAMEKLKKKNLDFIVANDVTKEGAGFNSDTNIVTIIDKEGNKNTYPMMNKREVAKVILDRVKSILDNKS
ncbi:bifunctional phosphopantothenoylcysteine decarboxylase/phosphopantothenate--cysteine ligase CoaBC [Tissierella sp.]|uniref:bifunctional phosphopantothenoylcysteine decarboxylase/phosphopantothenate--cysteine ligase CoaBC n=1 Tax=Tissierella sp. TaxID=41274 RepID=UPI0028A8F512|nr:bifunctional phosphopantothenoylcysteine decarboxylase/phosphopantothenate--cysteine ligase CoaBC [Tissierella sp.]